MTSLDSIRRVFRRARPPATDLPLRVATCREVLHANNAALGFLCQVQEALAGTSPLPPRQVRRLVAGVTTQTYRMIVNLDRMIPGRCDAVMSRFHAIKSSLARSVEVPAAAADIGYVCALADVDASWSEAVGQKTAFLGEARRWLPAHVPRGFGTSIGAYEAFMRHQRLGERVAELLARAPADDVGAYLDVSEAVVGLIEQAEVPPDIAAAIERAAADIPGGSEQRFAVRSSALMEGGVGVSFAGQYRSLLNVPARSLVQAFREVVAGKYSPRPSRTGRCAASTTERSRCAACVVEMVDAVAAGVLYSSSPGADEAVTLIQAVRGLGLSAVDGSVEPDSYTVGRTSKRLLQRARRTAGDPGGARTRRRRRPRSPPRGRGQPPGPRCRWRCRVGHAQLVTRGGAGHAARHGVGEGRHGPLRRAAAQAAAGRTGARRRADGSARGGMRRAAGGGLGGLARRRLWSRLGGER